MSHSKKHQLKMGITAALPIAFGYIPVAITFGFIARSSLLNFAEVFSLSAFVFAGASQFIGANLLYQGIGGLEIILTTFFVNLRHLLMSASLTQKVEKSSMPLRMFFSFGITDESYAVASTRNETGLSPYFMLGLNFTAYLSWLSGSILGFFFSGFLPSSIQESLGISLYAMFISLLIPSIKKSRRIMFCALFAALFNYFFLIFLSSGWSLIVSAALAAFILSLFSEEEKCLTQDC